jgi:hypothetical protein
VPYIGGLSDSIRKLKDALAPAGCTAAAQHKKDALLPEDTR